MNKLIALLGAAAGLLGFAAAPLAAQPALKIAIVDMAKLLDDHPETASQNEKLRTDERRAQEELEKLNKEGQTLVDSFRELEEKIKNSALSTEAREKIQNEMREKADEIQRKQNEVQSFRANTQRSLQQRIQNFRKVMFDRISAIVADIAKREGFTLVLDKSGPTAIGLSSIIYHDPAYDITEKVKAEFEKGSRSAATTTETGIRIPTTR